MSQGSFRLLMRGIASVQSDSTCAVDIRTYDCKFRQRFAIVAKAIAISLGHAAEEYW